MGVGTIIALNRDHGAESSRPANRLERLRKSGVPAETANLMPLPRIAP